jgi:hypothetical protein
MSAISEDSLAVKYTKRNSTVVRWPSNHTIVEASVPTELAT